MFTWLFPPLDAGVFVVLTRFVVPPKFPPPGVTGDGSGESVPTIKSSVPVFKLTFKILFTKLVEYSTSSDII